MKDVLIKTAGITFIVVLIVLAFFHATSAESWYAGIHTEGCTGKKNCNCYEKLVAMDKQRIHGNKSRLVK